MLKKYIQNRNNKYISSLSIIIIMLMFISCEIDKTKIDYLHVFYLESGTNTNTRIDCDFLKGNWDGLLHNTLIKKVSFLKEFENEFLKYKELNSNINIDARIKVLVFFKNKKVDTLCLGEFFNTFINGKSMKDNAKLLNILKKQIDYNKPIDKRRVIP